MRSVETVLAIENEKKFMGHPTPWTIETIKGEKRFDVTTGEQRPPVDYHYIRDAKGDTIKLFVGTNPTDEQLARFLAIAPQLLEIVEALLAEKIPDGERYSFKSKEESDLYMLADKLVSKARSK